jgi:phosphate transport system substrate-binding protein
VLCAFRSICLFLSLSILFIPNLFAQSFDSIQIKGSDTMVNLGQAWAEAFIEKNPDAFIAVTGGGSGTGIAALINGTCEIAQASRDISKKERELAAKNGRDVKELKVAIDAVAVVVHPSNPVSQLSIEQLSGIFTGEITNWNKVGGKDEAMLVLSRERNSGTHIFILEEVVRKGNKKGPEEFAPFVLMMSSSQAIEQEVSDNTAAIGYFGMGYLGPRVKAIGIMNRDTHQYVWPTVEDAASQNYPLSRPLHFYLPGEPTEIVQNFINFVLSEQGQDIVLDMEFVPLPSL